MYSKRALNSATKRYNMLTYVIQKCSSQTFEDLYVNDICQKTGISKVTFFKYFAEKDDILLYYKSLLTINLNIKIQEKSLNGKGGLEQVFTLFTNEYKERPSMVLGMLSKLVSGPSPYRPMRLTPAEKHLFFPETDFEKLDLLSMEQLIDKLMLEGVLAAEIKSTGNVADLGNYFLANIYGSIILSHVKGDSADRMLFQNTMRSFLRSIN